jgi:hypothetical protein
MRARASLAIGAGPPWAMSKNLRDKRIGWGVLRPQPETHSR